MKKYLFLFFVGMGIVLFAYWTGGQVAWQKCNAQIQESGVVHQRIITEQIGRVNEKTFNTGVRDIRRVLCEKYTIAE